jgi:hypothetical protein
MDPADDLVMKLAELTGELQLHLPSTSSGTDSVLVPVYACQAIG